MASLTSLQPRLSQGIPRLSNCLDMFKFSCELLHQLYLLFCSPVNPLKIAAYSSVRFFCCACPALFLILLRLLSKGALFATFHEFIPSRGNSGRIAGIALQHSCNSSFVPSGRPSGMMKLSLVAVDRIMLGGRHLERSGTQSDPSMGLCACISPTQAPKTSKHRSPRKVARL